jgi:hypothetical protein
MSMTSAWIKRRLLGAAAAGGVAAVAAVSMLAAPSAALAAPAGPHARPDAVQPTTIYDSWTASLDGRTITLWLNTDTLAYHAEISGGSGGDRIHLDYASSDTQIKDKTYQVDTADVPFNDTFANTGDHRSYGARACGTWAATARAQRGRGEPAETPSRGPGRPGSRPGPVEMRPQVTPAAQLEQQDPAGLAIRPGHDAWFP